ncbi:hypothetical protein KR51_00029510 [Rubidibacter lacunae KORDI 51-2]|uniref:Uncharacterized protein n=1 Tax=Rubidibacter lacunae KORDI 51-2 TaxID=582515 RepID=U5DGJ7_9CHRO|nr:hypothetical protein [Rubidibacter lacunae]ERN40412.1 hypothetical protein KR51_00029510 [Rubidibacter lacunae KORDI 51-2]
MRSIYKLILTGVALSWSLPARAQQVSLEQLCRSFPQNSRCVRVEQGLPSVVSGVGVPDNGTCTPLLEEQSGTDEVVAGGGSLLSGVPLVNIIAGRGNRKTNFLVPASPPFSSYIVQLQALMTAEYRITLTLDYPNRSNVEILREGLMLFEQQLHGLSGSAQTGQPSRLRVDASSTNRPSATYRLAAYGCR